MSVDKIRTSALAGGISILALSAAWAQDVPETEAPEEAPLAEDGSVLLDPIVIYGDRTTRLAEQSLASVAVVGEKALETPTVSTWRDAFRRMANVQNGDWTESGVLIRGVNSEGQTPGGLGAPLVSFYIDGVQQTVEGTRRGARGTFDAQQFEVFRGPQSTLSGRAALAGAMYLRTRDPDFLRSGAAQVTYGENNHRQVGLAFGDALNDRIAYRISGEWSDKDNDLHYPSYERFDRYEDFVDDEYWTARGKLLWLPTGGDATRVLLSFGRSFDSPASNDIAGPNWSSDAPSFSKRRGDVWGTIMPDYYRTFGLTEIPAYQDVRETTVDNVGLEITHEINPALLFTSMTGYSHSVTDRNSINAGTPGEVLITKGEFDQELASQEFRLNYETEPLRAVGGYYVSQEDQNSWRDQQLLSYTQSRNKSDIFNQAVFGEISYEFAPRWRAIGGGRVDYIRQDNSAIYRNDGVKTSDTSSNYSDTVFIPKVGIEYAFLDNQTVALVYQEGYRPGGSGVRASDGAEFDYDPEWAKSLELAWRGRALQDKLRIAANFFYQDWKNQQVEVWANPLDSSSSYIANVGKSTSYGAELELAYQATARLELYGSLGLLKTEFDEFQIGQTDFSGLPFPGAPEHTAVLGYVWGADTGFFTTGNLKYVGSFMSRLESGLARPMMLDAYTTVDLTAGYAWDRARLTLYGTNIFDKQYFTYDYGPDAYATLGDRREIGVQLSYAF